MFELSKIKPTTLFITLIISYFQFSCSSPVVINEESVIICDVGKVSNNNKQILLSELVDSIEIVKLETIENSYIKHKHLRSTIPV